MRQSTVSVALVSILLFAVSASAQTRLTVTVTAAAPVFVTANESQAPLRVAREGSVLLLVAQDGDWCQVEFQDPQFGRRVGYIQTKYVRLNTAPEPVNLSVPSAPGQGPVVPRPGASTPAAPSSQQRGDFTVGYVFIHVEDDAEGVSLSLPLGIAASDAYTVRPNVDIVFEAQFAHGTVFGPVSQNAWAVSAGPRFWGGSRYGSSVRGFGQVLVGLAVTKALFASRIVESTTGIVVQPGAGVEVPVASTVAIRPQFDIVFARFDEQTTNGVRFSVNAVFRLFRQ